MSESILTRADALCNHPMCPNCRSQAHYSAGIGVIVCKACNTTIVLSPAQNSEMLDSWRGITALPTEAYLQLIKLS